MNLLNPILFIGLALGFFPATRLSPEPLVFVGSTPCDGIPRTMLSIPAQTPCEFITWSLTLRQDPRNQAPTRYTLTYTYGLTQPSTQGFLNGGTTATKEGTWSVVKGPGNRESYRLNAEAPATALSFLRLDDNLLHLLDPEGKLMIGHEGWSYTLNRKK